MKEYSNNLYSECPYCKSSSIESQENDFDGSVMNCHMYCVDCEEQWDDCYEITSRFDKEGNQIQKFETWCNKENA